MRDAVLADLALIRTGDLRQSDYDCRGGVRVDDTWGGATDFEEVIASCEVLGALLSNRGASGELFR